MDLAFGARLRLQRERQQVALTAIAEETKINGALLEGLERDDVSRWPGGVFRRAYVRAYAQAIGLQPEEVLREFLELYPDPVEENSAVVALAQSPPGDSGSGPSTRLGFLIRSAVAALPHLGGQRAMGSRSATGQTPTADVDSSTEPPPPPVEEAKLSTIVPAEVAPAEGRSVIARESRIRQRAPRPTGRSKPSSADTHTSTQRETLIRLERDLLSVARLCTTLACAHEHDEITSVLADVTRILEARAITMWVWDPRRAALCPVLAHGYSDELLARLPRVGRNTDNAIAAAFRTAETRVVKGTGRATGAFVAPILTSSGCVGVLALEFGNSGEQRESLPALATILSAQLSTLVGDAPLAQAASA